jgi:6,7-dimethyl-8-ribityllumazine synthase
MPPLQVLWHDGIPTTATMHNPSIPTDASARGFRVGLAVSGYHSEIVGKLREGARAAFLEMGGIESDLIELECSGSFELPAVAAALADREEIDAVVALGCIVAGETQHDEVIAHAVAQGLTHLSLELRKPIALGILTCDTIEQAMERAGGRKGNKGVDAMRAAVQAARAMQAAQRLRLPARRPR